jgi:hypothetical protein
VLEVYGNPHYAPTEKTVDFFIEHSAIPRSVRFNSLSRMRPSKDHSQREVLRMKLPNEELMDALSLTRERVRVWVSAPLRDTPAHWRRRRILIRGDFSRPACTLSPTLSRRLETVDFLFEQRNPRWPRALHPLPDGTRMGEGGGVGP